MTDHFKDHILQITQFIALSQFEAVSYGGMNLDKSAWPDLVFTTGNESRYPAQVRVRWTGMYPLPGHMLWPAVGDHASNPHLIRLTVPQVHNILEVFQVNMRICDVISKWGAGYSKIAELNKELWKIIADQLLINL